MSKIKTIHTLGADYDIYDAAALHTTDSTLSESSTNPIENQAVTQALSTKSDATHIHDERYYLKSEAASLPKVTTMSYAGTGTCGSANAKSLTFEKPPLAVLIFGKEIGLTAPGTDMKVLRVSSEATSHTTWAADQKSVSWYHTDGEAYMLNSSGYTYNVVVFYES